MQGSRLWAATFGKKRWKNEELRSTGAEAVEDAKRVAQKVQTVIIFVLNDQQVIDTISGPNGVLEGCGPSSGFGKSRFVEINSSD